MEHATSNRGGEPTDELARALADHLDAHPAASRDGAYRVEEVLKRSDAEVTEVVCFPGLAGGEMGPFVRKRFAHGAGGADVYRALLRAQRSGARFSHLPFIVDVYEAGEECHVVMEYVAGETLAAYVERHGASVELAEALVPQVAAAVDELHRAVDPPIIHRDLKPSNLMVSGGEGGDTPSVTVIDLGIARFWHEGAEADTTHLGTRRYAPPEQFGFGQTDVRSDVYALGKIAAFCCTGREPAVTLDATGLACDNVPVTLSHVILKATAFDPLQRYASAAEFGLAWEEASGHVKALAAPVTLEPPVFESGWSSKSIAEHMHGVVVPAADRLLQPHSWLWKASLVLGVLWDAFQLLVFCLASYYALEQVFAPTGDLARLAFANRLLLAVLIIIAPCAAICWAILDKRLIRRVIPSLPETSFRRDALRAAAVTIGGYALYVVIAAIFWN